MHLRAENDRAENGRAQGVRNVLGVAAALYDRVMAGVEEGGLTRWRSELLAPLSGTVVEIGAGTGRNLPIYPATVNRLVLCEPDRHMRDRLVVRAEKRRGATITAARAEALDVADGSADAVVSTLVLCSVTSPGQVLAEVRRVLRPGGRFVFIEHVAATDRPGRFAWQRRIEPIWRLLAGNCHLTRSTEQSITDSGLRIDHITRASMRRAPAIVRPSIRGVAVQPDP